MRGTTSSATKMLMELFEGKIVFQHPKPIELIENILQIVGPNENVLVFDSFAGSGTTGQAVMNLNKKDGGQRTFALVQMTEATKDEPKNICKDITRERLKRAIEKFGYSSGFKYQKVGIPLDDESMLKGNLPTYKQLAKYVHYLCTGENLKNESKINEAKYLVGDFGNYSIYLIYKQDYDTLTKLALNINSAENFKKASPNKRRIVYAPACFLDEDYLKDNQIDFVNLPYNLFERNTG